MLYEQTLKLIDNQILFGQTQNKKSRDFSRLFALQDGLVLDALRRLPPTGRKNHDRELVKALKQKKS